METFAIRLKKAIDISDHTQQYVADQLNLDRSTVSHWVGGRNTPNPGQLARLSSVLGVSCDYLCGLEDQRHVYDLPPALRVFIRGESPNPAYPRLAAEIKRAGVSPETVRTIVNAIERNK